MGCASEFGAPIDPWKPTLFTCPQRRTLSTLREFSPAAVRKAQEQDDRGELSETEIARLAGGSRQTVYRYSNFAGDGASNSAAWLAPGQPRPDDKWSLAWGLSERAGRR